MKGRLRGSIRGLFVGYVLSGLGVLATESADFAAALAFNVVIAFAVWRWAGGKSPLADKYYQHTKTTSKYRDAPTIITIRRRSIVRRVLVPWFWMLVNLLWMSIVLTLVWDAIAFVGQKVVAASINALWKAMGQTIGDQVLLLLYIPLGGLIGFFIGCSGKYAERNQAIQKAMHLAWEDQEERDARRRERRRPAWHQYLDNDDERNQAIQKATRLAWEAQEKRIARDRGRRRPTPYEYLGNDD